MGSKGGIGEGAREGAEDKVRVRRRKEREGWTEGEGKRISEGEKGQ